MSDEPAGGAVWVSQFEVEGLRKVRSARIEPAQGINWIVGPNGAGKTTLLEGLYLLSRGKSFRGAKHGSLFATGMDVFFVRGRLVAHGRSRDVGFHRERGDATWVENGVRKTKVGELTVRMHVRLIGENAQRLLEGDPELRRLFLDWNLFHVEPGYGELLSRFRRVRTQRNAWLRAGGRGRPVWDESYARLSGELTRHRRRFVAAMARELTEVADALGMAELPRIDLGQGWPGGEDALPGLLAEYREADVRRGFTYLGPNRGDLHVGSDSAVRGLRSRGELKLTVAALQLAAQRLWDRSGVGCVWLIDDLAAELDRDTVTRVWKGLAGTGLQIFATSLGPTQHGGCVFHVEQGRVTPAAT